MEISGKVALVTGASAGIGRATACLLARQGAKVALAARSVEKLEELARELPESLVIPTDMRDEEAVRAMIGTTAAHYGRLDILVNNAGQGMHTSVASAPIAIYRSVFELNVVGPLVAMQTAIPVMRRQGGGVIVNVSSGTTKTVIPQVGPYASTKHAINGLSLVAQAELEGENIHVCLVYPGLTATDFGHNSAAREREGSEHDYAKHGDSPEYVAELILRAIETEEAEVFAERVAGRL